MIGLLQKALLTISIISCFTVIVAAASNHNNDSALKGIKTAQVYFDVSLKDDNLLVFRMEMLDKTIKQIEDAGLEVRTVVGFRGGASRFITKDDHYVLEEEISNKKKIQDWVKQFSERGIIIEQCSIAAGILDIPQEDFMEEIKVVGNGYISLVGYQAQGYSVVPMD
ncbi:MAG: DsrE family protein [Desulfofustis sp.]|nr:DsrE family protein [Desulfofustis sp.]